MDSDANIYTNGRARDELWCSVCRNLSLICPLPLPPYLSGDLDYAEDTDGAKIYLALRPTFVSLQDSADSGCITCLAVLTAFHCFSLSIAFHMRLRIRLFVRSCPEVTCVGLLSDDNASTWIQLYTPKYELHGETELKHATANF
jgi:hypothetical protein